MHKLLMIIDEEIKEIERQGINYKNLNTLSELIDIKKDICEIKEIKRKLEEIDKDKELEEHSKIY